MNAATNQTLKERTLGKIKNERIRAIIDKGLTNLENALKKKKLTTAAKLMPLLTEIMSLVSNKKKMKSGKKGKRSANRSVKAMTGRFATHAVSLFFSLLDLTDKEVGTLIAASFSACVQWLSENLFNLFPGHRVERRESKANGTALALSSLLKGESDAEVDEDPTNDATGTVEQHGLSLPPEEEALPDNSAWWTGIVKMMCGLMGVLGLMSTTIGTWWTNKSKNAKTLSDNLRSTDTIAQNICSYFSMGDPEEKVACHSLQAVENLIDQYLLMDNLTRFDELDEIDAVLKEAKERLDKWASQTSPKVTKAHARVSRRFDEIWKIHLSCRQTLNEVNDVRPVPVGGHLYGPAAHGKSYGVLNHLIPRIAKACELKTTKTGLVYMAAVNTAYMEKPTGQPFFVSDEFLALGIKDPLLTTGFFNLLFSGDAGAKVHGAAVEDKNQRIKPRFVITISNFEKLTKPANDSSKEYVDAVNSRLNGWWCHTPYLKTKDRRGAPVVDENGDAVERKICYHSSKQVHQDGVACTLPDKVSEEEIVDFFVKSYHKEEADYQKRYAAKKALLLDSIKAQGADTPTILVVEGHTGHGKTHLIGQVNDVLRSSGVRTKVFDDVLPNDEDAFCQAFDEDAANGCNTTFLIGANFKTKKAPNLCGLKMPLVFPELHSRTLRRLGYPGLTKGHTGGIVANQLAKTVWIRMPEPMSIVDTTDSVLSNQDVIERVKELSRCEQPRIEIRLRPATAFIPQPVHLNLDEEGDRLTLTDSSGLGMIEKRLISNRLRGLAASTIRISPAVFLTQMEMSLNAGMFTRPLSLTVRGESGFSVVRVMSRQWFVYGADETMTLNLTRPEAVPPLTSFGNSVAECFQVEWKGFFKRISLIGASLLGLLAAGGILWHFFKSDKIEDTNDDPDQDSDEDEEDEEEVMPSATAVQSLTDALNEAAGLTYQLDVCAEEAKRAANAAVQQSREETRAVKAKRVRQSREDTRTVKPKSVRQSREDTRAVKAKVIRQPHRSHDKELAAAEIEAQGESNISADLMEKMGADDNLKQAIEQHLLDFRRIQESSQFSSVASKVLTNNVVVIGKGGTMFGQMIEGREGACPAHVVTCATDELIVMVGTAHFNAAITMYEPHKDLLSFKIDSPNCPQFPNIVKFLANEALLSTRSHAAVLRRRNDKVFTQFGRLEYFFNDDSPYHCGNFRKDIGLISTPCVEAFTKPGDCGSPVLLSDKRAGHELLTGLHAFIVRGTGQMGFSLLTAEWWAKRTQQQAELPALEIVKIEGNLRPYNVTKDVADTFSTLEDAPTEYLPENTERLSVLGVADKPLVGAPNKTGFVEIPYPHSTPSPNHPSMVPISRFPPEVKEKWGLDLKGEPHRAWNQIRKCDIPTSEWDPELRKKLSGVYASYFLDVAEDKELRPLSNFEVNNKPLNGPLADMTSSPKNTSVGYTLKTLYGVGQKGDLLRVGKDGFYHFKDCPATNYLLACVNHMEKTGEALFFPTVATEKDELLPTAKLETGKVRLFSAVDAIQMFVSRKYLGCFIGFAKNHLHEIHHTVGIDPLRDFAAMEARLNVHPNVFTWDYSAWDKVMPTQLQEDGVLALKNIISATYPEKAAKLAMSQLDLMVDRLEVYRDTVMEYHGTFASGIQLTNFLNSVVNDFVIIHALAALTGCHDLDVIHNNTWWVTHGDDVKMSVSDAWKDKVNYFRMKEFLATKHMTITPGEKTDEERPFESAMESSFISRYPYEFGGTIVGRLKKVSIEKTLDWTQNTSTDHLLTLAETNLEDACLWEEPYFEDIRKTLNDRFKRLGLKVRFPGYHAYRQRLLERMGAAVSNGMFGTVEPN